MTADAVYDATIPVHPLAAGEKGTVMLMGSDMRQARILYNYARTYLREIPLLAGLLTRETSDVLELSNSIAIEARPSSYRTVRGATIVRAVADELAFVGIEDSALSDAELLAALKPALATTNGTLTCGSTPMGKKGELYRLDRLYWGRDDAPQTLIWHCTISGK